MSATDTPRTDKQCKCREEWMADFARNLERELATVCAERDAAQGLRDEALEQVNAVETVMVDLRKQLADAIAESKVLNDAYVSERDKLREERTHLRDELVAEKRSAKAYFESYEKLYDENKKQTALLADLLAAIDDVVDITKLYDNFMPMSLSGLVLKLRQAAARLRELGG